MKKSLLALSLSLSLVSIAQAKTINLYDQPNAKSKVAASIDTANGIISIYSPENSEWIKVGDPHNGNVGWIKKSDLGGDAKINFNIITSGGNGQNYQVFQFGNSAPYSSEDAAKAMQEIKARQKAIQDTIQKSMQQFWNSFPVMVPVIVVPENGSKTTSTTTKKTAP